MAGSRANLLLADAGYSATRDKNIRGNVDVDIAARDEYANGESHTIGDDIARQAETIFPEE
jgi:hypothetical protein